VSIIYLDYNCFQRSFDDPGQIKIQMEALACEEIFKRAEKKQVKLAWSFMHEDENFLCPILERKLEVTRLSNLCRIRCDTNNTIYELAKSYQQKAHLSAKDAVHLSCAVYMKSNFFITCDDALIKRSKRLNLAIRVMNPVEYIREVESQ
jgi:predicted nucleic acid-binding protein